MRRFVLFLLFLVIYSNISFGVILKKIDIIGCKPKQKKMLITYSGLKVNSTLYRNDIRQAIKNLWKTGLFSDIVANYEVINEDSVALIFNVKLLPSLHSYEIKGNKKIKLKKIKEKITLVEGMIISPAEAKKISEKIYDLYKEDGYLQAKITPVFKYLNSDSSLVDLIFKIDEGQKVKIRKIFFHNNIHISSKKLRKQMKTKAKSLFRSGEFKEEQYEEDKDKIIRYYKKEGYKDAYIVKDSFEYSENLKDLYIHIFVEEGIRYKIGTVTFEGNTKFEDKVLYHVIKLKTGDWYNIEKYEKSLEELANIYREEGYLYVDIVDQVVSDSNILNISFKIIEKQPVYVNKVLIKGNTKTKEKVIRREVVIFPGEIYRQSRMMRSFRNIMQLNFFSNVQPDIQTIDEKHVNVVFKVEEKPTGQVSMGAGWSERDKLVGTFSIGMPNFLGNGQLVDLNIDYGSYRKNYSIGFTEPWLFDTPTQLGIQLRNETRYWIDAFDQHVKGLSVWVGRRLKWPDDYFSASVRYRLDQQKLDNFSSYFNDDIYGYKNEDWPKTTSSMTFTISRSSIDKPEFPNTGSINTFSYELAGGIFGGSYDYHKEMFKSSWFFPTIGKFILSLKMTFGNISGYGKNSEVPYVEKFQIGGTAYDGQVRGYDDRSIHPPNDYAGNTMLIFNVEYTLPIVEGQIYGLLFADAGNSWNSFSKANIFDLKKSVGAGVRIVIPLMGILGFDFGYGFDAANPGWKPHFQIGRSF